MDRRALQSALRETLEAIAQDSISSHHTLQVMTLSVDKGSVVCTDSRVRGRKLLNAFSTEPPQLSQCSSSFAKTRSLRSTLQALHSPPPS